MSSRLLLTSILGVVSASDDHVQLMQATKFATSEKKMLTVDFDGEMESDDAEEISDCDQCVADCVVNKAAKGFNEDYCEDLCKINGRCHSPCTMPTSRPASLAPEEQTSSHVTNGTLVICGGACISKGPFDVVLEKAGGAGHAKLAWIPTNWDIYKDYTDESVLQADFEAFKELSGWGNENLIIVHTGDRSVADTQEFADKLKDVTGIWMKGGRQWRGIDVYKGTKTEEAIKAVLAKGGVFGGTSAGASIQGDFMVRGDTDTNQYIIAQQENHLWGFGFLHNVAIDQHNTQRRRNGGVLDWIELHPEYLGISLDENTAIVVEGDEFEVIGENYVEVTDATLWQSEKFCSNYSMVEGLGRPLLPHQERYFFLKASSTIGTRFPEGDRYNIKTREVLCCAKR